MTYFCMCHYTAEDCCENLLCLILKEDDEHMLIHLSLILLKAAVRYQLN